MIYIFLLTALFQYRIETQGFYDQCVYKSPYGIHVVSIESHLPCPMSIEVEAPR